MGLTTGKCGRPPFDYLAIVVRNDQSFMSAATAAIDGRHDRHRTFASLTLHLLGRFRINPL